MLAAADQPDPPKKYVPSTAPALPTPAAGASVNPSFDAHQAQGEGPRSKPSRRTSFDYEAHGVSRMEASEGSDVSSLPAGRARPSTLISRNISFSERKQFAAHESFNYDQPENQLYELKLQNLSEWDAYIEELMRWVIALITGVAVGLVGFYVHNLTRVLEQVKFEQTNHFVEELHVGTAYGVYLGFSAFFVLVACILVAYVEPQAKGSGIPEVKSILNGNHLPRVIRFRTLISKTFGIAFSVGGGLFVGKEGPMVHSGSIVAAGVSQGPPRGCSGIRRFLQRFRNDKEKRDFISMGCAAGVAAAFGAPIGGVLFSFEEASTHWEMPHTVRTFFCTMVTTSTMNFWMQWVLVKHAVGGMSENALVAFGAFEGPAWNTTQGTVFEGEAFKYVTLGGYRYFEFFFFAFIGVCCGLLGALFNAANVKICKKRMKQKHRWQRVLEAVIMAVVTATFTFWVPYVFPCQDAMPEDYGWEKFFCEEGQESQMATLMFGSMPHAIKHFFHSPYQFNIGVLVAFFFVFYVVACVTYGISIPSGIFIPSVIIGACFGRLIGELVRLAIPDIYIAAGAYALVGGAAFLGGVSRMTISICVILLEASNMVSYAMPVMLCTVMAKLTGDFFNHGLFDIHVRMKCVPLLEPMPDHEHRLVAAREVMAKPVICFKEVVRVSRVVEVLKSCNHNGFPVIRQLTEEDKANNTGQFLGIILRTQLSVLLARRVFTTDLRGSYDIHVGAGAMDTSRLDELVPYDVFCSYYPKFPNIDEIDLSDDDMDKFINLTPYYNSGAFSVGNGVKMDRIFRMVRMLGLRHLTVVDLDNRVTGMITRKDLMPHKTAESLLVAQSQYLAEQKEKLRKKGLAKAPPHVHHHEGEEMLPLTASRV